MLLVDDNALDVRAIVHAAERLLVEHHVQVATDGEAALRHLRAARSDGASEARPDLVLLDLDLPGTDGRRVLAEMKADPELRRIPVVVLSTSDADDDVLGAYDLGASAFVTKPVGLDGWLAVGRAIEGFWFGVVKLPPR